MNTYEIERKLNKTGKHYVYYPTVNGKRLTSTNFLRKYDACGTLENAINKLGADNLYKLSKGLK